MTLAATSVPVAAFSLAAPAAPSALRAAAVPTLEAVARGGALALVTCQRIELFVPAQLAGGIGRVEPWTAARRLEGADAARHAIGLAIGLESAVLGEDQVLHQVRTHVAAARAADGLARPLELLFEAALRAGRVARSWRPARPRSLADVAVARAAAGSGGMLDGQAVLVVGTGEMGRLAAAAASAAGARVAVASPRPGQAADLAATIGGTAVPFDPGVDGAAVDAVIVALAGPWSISAQTAAALGRVRTILDLSMPPSVPANLARLLGSSFVGIDDLLAAADADSEREGATARYRRRLERLRDRTVDEYVGRLARRASADLAAALARRIERERAAEIETLWRDLPGLADADRDRIEAMTRRLARRLFRAPLSRLGSDPAGRRRMAARELFEL